MFDVLMKVVGMVLFLIGFMLAAIGAAVANDRHAPSFAGLDVIYYAIAFVACGVILMKIYQ